MPDINREDRTTDVLLMIKIYFEYFYHMICKHYSPLKVSFAKSIFKGLYNDLLQTDRTLHKHRCESWNPTYVEIHIIFVGVSHNLFLAKMLIVEW
jgi:hypothetical protein